MIKSYKLLIGILLYFCTLPQTSFATHIVGGALTYVYNGGSSYTVTLKLYRDCAGAALPGTVAITVAGYNGAAFTPTKNFNIALTSSSFLPPNLDSCAQTPSPIPCVQEGVYTTTINTLPPNPGGYHLYFQLIARNVGITNINATCNCIGESFYAYIPGSSYIWLEDFTLPNGTTSDVGATAWTRALGTTPPTSAQVTGNLFEVIAANNGEATWTSQTINILPYPSGVNVSVNLSEVGTMDATDTIFVYYRLNGGPLTPFTTNGFIADDFTNAIASVNGIIGNDIQIVIRTRYDGLSPTSEIYRFDNVNVFGNDFVANNNPTYAGFPPLFLCVGNPFTFNHSAIDTDGDSLAYSFYTPYDGDNGVGPLDPTFPGNVATFTPVIWLGGFSANNPLGGAPLTLNPTTGILTGTPTMLGQFVVGVKVKEYRNGVYLSETLRDFQFNIINCPPPAQASITPSGTLSVCGGNSLTFPNNSDTIANNWLWNFGDLTTTNDTSSLEFPTYTYPGLGAYTAQLIINAGTSCADTATATITVTTPPAAPTATGTTICEGTSATVTATTPGGTYEWYDAASGGTLLFTGASYTTPVLVATTTYYVQTTVNGCTSSRTAVTVTVSPIPAAPTASGTTICSGNTATVTATAPGGTYEWYDAASGGTLLFTGASYTTPVLVATTTYYVQTTVAGCAGPRTAVTVTVNPIPAAPTASGTTICSGNTATVTATAPGGIYEWYDAASGGTLLFTGASYTTPVLVATTTYYVQTTVGGCISPRTAVMVTVNPIPAAPTAGGTTICSGNTATVTATAPGGTYEWYDAASGGTLLFTGAGYTTPVLTTTDTFYVQSTISGCTGPRTAVTVTVNPIPAAPTASGTTICTGTTATVTATAPGGTYEWYDAAVGGTLLFTGASYTTPVLVATTTYYVQTTIGGCTGTRTAVTVTVNPIPAAPTASGTTICSGNTATITATAPGGTYRWYNAPLGGTLLFTGASYTTPVLATTTTYYVQTTVGGCISPRTAVTVTVNPTPAAPTAGGTTICSGNTATVTATAPGGTYEWYDIASGGTLLFTGASYTTPVLSTTDTFYVQSTITGCTGSRTAVVVTVTPTDDPSFNYSSGTYCVTGTNPTPTITGGFGGTFTATPAGLTINSSTGTITLGSSALNTYTITFTTNGPCPDNSSVNITITNAPDATFSYTTPLCQSGGNELPSFPIGSSGGIFSAAPAGLVFVNTSTGEIDVQSSLPNNYTITNFIAAAGGCSQATSTFDITIDQAATVDAGTYSDICSGTTLSLNGIIGGSANSATWSGGTGTYAPNANTLNATYTPSAGEQTAGIITLILTTNDPAGFCSAVADTVSVNIIPLPAAPTASGTTICEGESTTLTATAPGGSYQWYNAPIGGTLLTTGASYTTPILSTTTTYYVQTTVNGCAGPRTSVTVNVTPLPAAPTASGTTICSGNTATVTATAPGGAYEWFDASVGGISLGTGSGYTTPVLTSTDTFYVQTVISGCAGLRTPVVVTVNPIPTAPIVGNQTICNGSSATLTATAPGGTYEWYDAASGGTLLNTGATYTTPTLSSTTTYFVQTTVSGCASVRTTVTVTVNPIPAAPTANGTTICEGNTATLTATAPGATYRWYSAASGGTLLATGANYTTPILSVTTTYYVQTTTGGCTSPRTAVTVTVILNDNPSFAYTSGTYCITGADPTPVISGTTGGTFSSSPAGLTINPTTGEVTLSSSALGTYTVTYTTNGTCPMSSFVPVTITTAPDATFSFNSPYCQFTVNPFPTFSSGSSAGVFSASPAGLNFVNTGTGEIDLLTSTAGTYTITNFIAAAGGCDSATFSTTVVIEQAPTVNAGSDQNICVGNTVTLNGSFGGVATNATWFGGAGTFNPDNTTMNAVYTPTVGEYASGFLSLVLITNSPGGICTAASDTITILFNEDDPSFSYSSGTYCATGTNPIAIISGGSTGTFSAAPAGLVFVNASTGEINLGASTLGTYTVTFTTSGTCPASSSMSITITNGFDATFSYNTPVCQSGGNEIPTFSPGASAGVFSSTSGLVFVNTSTGEIDLAASTSGTYTVTNFIAASGGCSSATYSTSFTIDLSAISNAGTNMSICSGGGAILSGSIGGSASSATWSGGLGTFSPNNSTLNATYNPDLSETLVSLFLTSDDPLGSCSSVIDTVVITINPLPVAPTANGDTICEGTSTTLTATAPGGSYQWFSNPTGGSSLFNGANYNTPIITATTTYYVQTTVNGCSSSSRTPVTVTVNPTDDPSFNYATSTYCVSGGNAIPTITGGSTGIFTATPVGLVFADASTGEIDVAATTLGTYTITFTTNGQCPDSATFNVTITNAPDATFSYNNPYCASGSNPFPTFPIGASAGLFTALPAGLVFVNANTGQVNLSASTPGIYTVTNDIAAGGGCVQAIYSDTIEILPAPVVDAGVDTSICANNTQIVLNGSVINAGGMVWSTSGDGTFTPDTTSANVTYNAGTNDITNGSTTIYLTSTQNGVCNAVTDSILITINPAPNVDAGNDILICDGTLTTILNGSVSGGASSGMWTSLGTGTFSPDSITLNASYTFSQQDSIDGSVLIALESTNNGGCLTVYDTVEVLLSSPATAFAGIDTTVCVNNSLIQLGGTITGGTGEGIWSSLGGGTFTPTANDLNASYQLDSTDIANGFVTLILDAINSCVPASDTIIITVNPAPVVNAGNNITICVDETALLNGTVTFADGGQWTSNGTGTFIPNDTTLNASYVPSATDITLGTLELVLTSFGNSTCNAVSDTLMLSFSDSPVANFSMTGKCEGDSIQFNDSSTVAIGLITDYAWDFGNGDTSSVQNPTTTYSSVGSYTVILVVTSNSGCKDTMSTVITINPLPTAGFSYLSTCTTDTVLFTDNSTIATGSITQWSWDFGDLTTSILQNPSHGYGVVDTFSVSLTVTSDSGCTTNITQDVILAPQPIVDFGYVVNCQNSIVTFTDSSSATAGDAIVGYLWTFGNGNTSILQNPLPETYISGSYLVQLQITTQAGCMAIDTATINIAAKPTAAYIPQGGQFNLNEVINFTNQSVNSTTYHWDFGNNNDTSNVLNPSYGYATNGTFTVTLISSAGGCADTISYDFEIIGTPVKPVVVPTAFSPNSDGINDVFSILGGPFKIYQLTVYNEWGQEIFTSNEQIEGWDGSYKGNNQPTGSYVYVFNGLTIADETIKLHGEIAIVK